jgi:hypothetical protein
MTQKAATSSNYTHLSVRKLTVVVLSFLIAGTTTALAQENCTSALECAQRALDTAARAEAAAIAIKHELEGQVAGLQDQVNKRVTQCRVCFREIEGSNQCQGNRDSCSDWVGIGKAETWTQPFRDNTDGRNGSCMYQWGLLCR